MKPQSPSETPIPISSPPAQEPSPPATTSSTSSSPSPHHLNVDECPKDTVPKMGKESSPSSPGSPPPGWEERRIVSPPPFPRSPSPSPSPESVPPGWERPVDQDSSSPDKGQLVCGSCHELLSYPRVTSLVQCPSCQLVNFVLEEHQVGNVNCGRCSVLLMYPYGASSVRCSCCQFVTEIGSHNKRPRLSELQGHPYPSHGVNGLAG